MTDVITNSKALWDAHYDKQIGRGIFDYDRHLLVKLKHIVMRQLLITKVLDIGSGNGELTMVLRKDLKLEAYGIDISNRIVTWLNNQIKTTVRDRTGQTKTIKLFKYLDINQDTYKTKQGKEVKIENFLACYNCIIINKTLEYIDSKVLDKIKGYCIVVISNKKETKEKMIELLISKGFKQATSKDVIEEYREVRPELTENIYIRGLVKTLKKRPK